VAPFTGDRGDIQAKGVWKDGVWTLEIARKRVTGSEFDVQFDAKKEYAFGVAVFDGAQVRHAYSPGVLKMVLE
jgi:Ethylbenzene dehydrogenase